MNPLDATPVASAPPQPQIVDGPPREARTFAANAKRSVTIQQFSGPLPPPQLFAEYEKILPGSAERLLKQAEEQSAHRREIEKVVVDAGARDSLCGIIAGVIVTVASLSLAAYAVHCGHPAVAITIGATTLASLVGVFVTGTRQGRQERDSRSGK